MGVQEAGKRVTVHPFLLPEKKHFHLLQKGIQIVIKIQIFIY